MRNLGWLLGLLCMVLYMPGVPESRPKPKSPPVQFKRACEKGTSITLALASDILLHRPVRLSAARNFDKTIRDPELRVANGIEKVFWRIKRHIQQADVSYTNLEGNLARNCSNARVKINGYYDCKKMRVDPATVYDEKVYTTFPRFNFPPATARALKSLGFDVISVANNHMTDRYSNGVDMTLDELEKVKLVPVGGVRYKHQRNGVIPKARRPVVFRKKGVNIGFLAYTYGTNIKDLTGQVMSIAKCLKGDCDDVIDDIKRLRSRSDVDFVVVGLHWGQQHKEKPYGRQIQVAHLLLNAGADLIVGGHPHRLQPWEKYRTRDGRDTLIMYSLGDLCGSWTDWFNRTGVLIYVGITKPKTGKAFINGARVLPLYHYKTKYPPTGRLLYQTFPLSSKTRRGKPYRLVLDNFGSGNLIEPDEKLVTNPQCK